MGFSASKYNVDSPYGLAYRMAGYNSDPRYISAYVAREYGADRAPSPRKVEAMIEQHRRVREEFERERSMTACNYNPENDNGEPYRVPARSDYVAPLKPPRPSVYVSKGRRREWWVPVKVSITYCDPPDVTGLVHERILKAVAASFGMTVEEMKAPNRRRQHVAARMVAIRLLRDVRREDGAYRFSYPQIAKMVGKGDHSTVLHAINTFDIKCRQFPEIAVVYERLKDLAA